ncbi:EcsC family protein [Cribrihabitans pelagius]|uniref:EcsC family protein n=1 Tax=Cribrihabitans pelagius TaxID=1765746 RepID=UPI003B59CE18
MTDILPKTRVLTAQQVEAELDALAQRYRAAGGKGVALLNRLGSSGETLLERLPAPVRAGLTEAAGAGLRLALFGAGQSRRLVPDQNPGLDRLVSAAMGAAGGAAGLPGALVELPATTAFLLRGIQGAAAAEGFDPEAESVKFDCIQVFSAAGPLGHDDGADLGFTALRLSLPGSIHKLIARVAPRLGLVLGQKLAAQAVPVAGAFAGAAVNYVFAGYYREMAHVHFGLRRLAVEADTAPEELVQKLRARLPG